MSTPVRLPRAARTRSAFGAAFLSLVFPGLGHAYAGARARALGFAALPLLALAAVAGVGLRAERSELAALAVNPGVLNGLLIANVIAFLYRAVAAVDAWNVARFLNAADAGAGFGLGRARLPLNPLSIAGLAAVVLVMAGAHLAVWRYDTLALSVVNCLSVEGSDPNCDTAASASPNPSDAVPSDSGPASPGPTESPIPSLDSVAPGTTPAPTFQPWDGTGRLNILLVGTDQRSEKEATFNTDTMIVVSIDPKTKQVAMLQLPRDIAGVPCPPAGGTYCSNGVYTKRINSWFMNNQGRADLWPGNTAQARGFNALKAILGNLYGLDIQYYVKVDFTGFVAAVDTLGGLQVNVQMPVADDNFPLTDQIKTRVYIPAGPQEMDGTQGLVYARSRHKSDDFDRGHRQQRVILSLKNQLDPQTVFANLNGLVGALKKAVKTDIPIGDTATMSKLFGLASDIDFKGVRSYVFASPYYAQDMYRATNGRDGRLLINVARVQQAVKRAFSVSASVLAQQDELSTEAAQVWVLDGKGLASHATNNAAYLDYFGMDASAPVKPATVTPAQTTITAYNGAEAKLPQTVKYLQSQYGVTVATATDPTATADFVIVLGPNARDFSIPTAG